MGGSLWVIFTLVGAAGQTARNAMQRELTPGLGALGATLVRFLFGFPFALLFLAATMAVTGAGLPAMNPPFAGWTVLGAVTQIGGTGLMLLTMEHRSFVVTVAYLKAEPILVAIMGLVFLGDALSGMTVLAILVAMAGVAVISIKPEALTGGNSKNVMGPALLGLSSAALFGLSSVSYRGAILALHRPGYVMPATFSLAAGLAVQTGLLLAWLLLFKRQTLAAIFRLWRPSLLAGFTGAAASEMWFLAFALATAASVRTLGLVDVLFAQGVSHILFKQKTTVREVVGIVLLVAGAVLIVRAHPG
jgi:drug/metabolite transporter (DMT)-like permease